jgi:hypothetical protein
MGQVERVVLRIFDEAVAREDTGFEASWRSFLHAWNLLQFHEGVTVTSSEVVAETSYTMPAPMEMAVAERPDDAAPGKGTDPDFAELIDLATSDARPLIQAVYDAGLPWPELDYELRVGDACGPQADLAWPSARVAVLAERQLEDRPAYESAGWTTFSYPVEADELIRALESRRGRAEARP